MQIVAPKDIPKTEDIKTPSLFADVELFKTFQEMQIVCELEQGIGLSAVQVGLPLDLFVIKADENLKSFFDVPVGEYGYFMGCTYSSWDETEQIVSLEGCLSLKDDKGQCRTFEVPRYASVKVEGYRLLTKPGLCFEPITYYLKHDQGGVVFQHEIDHGLGVLICDIGKEVFIWRQKKGK
jgi:peptide deformylase